MRAHNHEEKRDALLKALGDSMTTGLKPLHKHPPNLKNVQGMRRPVKKEHPYRLSACSRWQRQLAVDGTHLIELLVAEELPRLREDGMAI